jgi:exodeoxyribonuclease VII large subunit
LSAFESKLDELQLNAIEIVESAIKEQTEILDEALAGFPLLIKEMLRNENTRLEKLTFRTSGSTEKRIDKEFHNFDMAIQKSLDKSLQMVLKQKTNLAQLSTSIKNVLRSKFENQHAHLLLFENISNLVNPETILKRGYSITLFNKKPLLDASAAKRAQVIETILYKGRLTSEIKSIETEAPES